MGRKKSNQKNPVAKFMGDFNRPATMIDRKREAKKGREKHKKPIEDS